MKLLNIGQREFVTPYGVWKPKDIIEIPEEKSEEYLCYKNEVKVLEEVKKEEAKEVKAETAGALEDSKETKKTKNANK